MFLTVKKWLLERLAVNLDKRLENWGLPAPPFMILAKILHGYNVLRERQLKLLEESECALEKFNYLDIILRNLPIEYTSQELYDIVAGRKDVLIEFLYKIHLEITDRKPRKTKFLVKKICQESEESISNIKPINDEEIGAICPILLNRWDSLKLHENYLVEIIRKSQQLREEFRKLLEKPSICDIKSEKEELPIDEDRGLDKYSFNDLLEQGERAKELEYKCEPDKKMAKAIFLQIRSRVKEKELDKLRTQLNYKILDEMWNRIEESKKPRCSEKQEETVVQLMKRSDVEHEIERKILEEKRRLEEKRKKEELLLKQKRKKEEEDLVKALFIENIEKNKKFQKEYEERINLHRKLYEERLKCKRLENEMMCADAVKDIVDLALKTAEYKKTYLEEPPLEVFKEWGRLFVLGLPILEYIPPTPIEEPAPEVDEEIQQALDRNEFEEYIDLIKDQDFFKNLRVLGHIIRIILTCKYPILPPIPPKPKLEYELAVCVNSVDLSVVDKLKYYLQNYAKIIQPSEVKDFCIKAYLEESREVEFDEEIVGTLTGKAPAKEKDSKKGKKGKSKGKSKKGSDKKSKKSSKTSKKGSKKGGKKGKGKKGKKEKPGEPPKPSLFDAQNQTPRLFPNERFLSEKAVLGKIGIEQTDDRLLVSMFIQYLKSFPEPAGWVLLNFPETFEQAIILEQYLTGEEVPKTIKTPADLERESKLLPLPEYEYKTPLTGYIKITHRDDFDVDTILEELLGPDDLNAFYTKQGCNHVFNCLEFDEESIKDLGKLIVGNFSLKPKESKDIFGELKKETGEKKEKEAAKGKGKKGKKKGKGKDKKKSKSSKSTKSGKSKKSSKGKKDKKGKKGKKGKKDKKGKKEKEEKPETPKLEMLDKEIQMPEIIEPIEDKTQPGEPGWIYCKLPVNKSWGTVLAIMWEKSEENYIRNFKEIFFQKRIIFNSIVPYLTGKRNEMFAVINTEETTKQTMINGFRIEFNDEITDEPVNEGKIYQEIEELEKKLLNICHETTTFEENKLREILQENWIYITLLELVNLVTNALQLEIDRFLETLRILTAFYKSTLQNVVPETDTAFKNLLLEKLQQQGQVNLEQTIENLIRKCLEFVDNNYKIALENMKKIETITRTKNAKEKKAEPLFVPEMVDIDKAVIEWKAALIGEKARILFYLNFIKTESLGTLEHIRDLSNRIFTEIEFKIKNKSQRESEQIGKTIKIFNKATKEKKVIHKMLLLDKSLSTVFLETFPEPLPVKENFQIAQLDYFVDILLDLARNGRLEAQTLKYFIQELLEQFNRVPSSWAKLTITDLDKLFERIYDPSEYIHWKDFIINNLSINWPREKMLKVRDSFRRYDVNCREVVTRAEYESLALFEKSVEDLIYKMYTTEENVFNYTAMLLDFCKDLDPIDGFTKALELTLGRPICREYDVGEDYVNQIMERREYYAKERKNIDDRIKEIEQVVKKILDFLIDKSVDECLLDVIIEEIDENIEKEEEKDQKSLWPSLINVQVEAEPKIDGKLSYFLVWELVEIVIKASILWHSKITGVKTKTFLENLKDIFEDCRNPEFGNSVLAHEFLNSDKLINFMGNIKKFLLINPCRVVEEINNQKL